MMNKVESLYDQLALEAVIEKIEEGVISDFTSNLYQAVNSKYPGKLKDISLEKFAAFTANWNPGKCGIGQKAQIQVWKNKYPNINGLPPNGKKSVKLYRDNDGKLSIKEGKKGKSNIDGIKSFDAVSIDNDATTTFFVFKTVDVGTYSESIGGGHQDNVQDELLRLISVVQDIELSFGDTKVKIIIVVDGRSSSDIIDQCKLLLNNKNITITNSENI